MKAITGSILILASSVFYLARINAQPINFHEAIRFASLLSLSLFIVGLIFILWELKSYIPQQQGGVNDVSMRKQKELDEG